MDSFKSLDKLKKCRIISVIRANSAEECVRIVDAVYTAGIKVVEITMTVPNAIRIIEDVRNKYENEDIIIGGGTVNYAIEASNCISAGAEFIVSPIYDKESGEVCNTRDILYIPGAFTPNEVFHCMRDGFKLIKIFPASWIEPIKLKELKGPFPHLEFLPTGGVSVENINEWFNVGAYAVSVGSAITKYAKDGNYKKVVEAAKAFLNAIK